jgi:8-oxo-dGTP pyrophosphatase MutT (NUDIX family)
MDKQKNQTDYYKSLPRKRMGSGVIIQNSKGEVLVLKTTYKDHWEIPGGVVEENESPKQTAEREVLEEIGLTINIRVCLVIHYRSAQDKQNENIMFIFNGGVITDETKFRLDGKEISEAKFVSFQEAAPLVGERIASRLSYCKRAIKEKKTIYLESIETLDPTPF